MRTPREVARIRDPERRLTAAAELAREAEAAVEEALAQRDMAIIVAHLDQGVAPITLYRGTLGISRGLFNRIIQRAPMERPEIPEAIKVAAVAHDRVRSIEPMIAEARRIRDDTAMRLMSGKARRGGSGKPLPPMSNADVARATNLTTARVHQIRTRIA